MIYGTTLKKRLPWITKEIKALIRKRNKLFRKRRTSRMEKRIQNMYLKRTLQSKIWEEYWKYLEGIICFNESDPNSERPQKQKKFWNYIKGLRKDNSGVAPLRDNGILVNNTQQKAEILNIQYHSVFTQENDQFKQH
jgi:hypothetical protein